MIYIPQSIGAGGRNWSVTVTTKLDSIDPLGQIIYAEGQCTIFEQTQGVRGPRTLLAVHTLDNKANNGKHFIRGKTIYKVGEERTCLQDVLQQLSTIGRAS